VRFVVQGFGLFDVLRLGDGDLRAQRGFDEPARLRAAAFVHHGFGAVGVGGNGDADSLNMDDPVNAHYWQQTDLQQRLQAAPGLGGLNGADYSAILFTGGYGTMWDFRESLDAQRLIREVYENGGIVAAVCHGPAALVDAKLSNGEYLVSGKNVAAFTNAEEEATGGAKIVPFLLETALVEHGAKHHAAPNWAENVVVDGRLITGQNPASAKGVGVALAKALG